MQIEAIPKETIVSDLIAQWRYKGESLEVLDDVFIDKIDYQLERYEDLRRLNETFLKVGSKYCDLLADRPKTRDGVTTFVKNLKTISGVIVEIEALTRDAVDISESPGVKRALEKLNSSAQYLRKELDATLEIRR